MGLLSRWSRSSDAIGLDIGSHNIKAVELEPTRDGIGLRRAGSRPTPPDTLRGGVVADPLSVAESVSALLEALSIDTTAAVAAVSGPTVVVRQVQLPTMPEKRLRKSIQWEARNYISFPVEDSVIEFQIVDEAASDDLGKMDVILCACPRDIVDSRVETLELAGLDPVAVEIEPFATIRSLIELAGGPEFDQQTLALVGMGAAYTDISIVKDRHFVLSRVIPIAGNAFTEAVSTALSIDSQEATRVKETAMELVTSEEERAAQDPTAQQASRAVEPLLEELTREISRSLAYYDYQQQAPETDSADVDSPGVNQIILSGGSARMAGIDRYLNAHVNVPVEIPNIFADGRLSAPDSTTEYLSQHSCELVVGAGLALRQHVLDDEAV
jgi:type IV pilus assembly protein PilM